MKPAIVVIAVIAIAGSIVGCAPSAESQQQNRITDGLVNNQPIPNIGYSQMRQNLIELETAESTGVQTTSFFFNLGIQDPVRTCPSIGVPIPNTASLSNPHQVDRNYGGSGPAVIDQMDPNGVYAPTNSSGTFVMCVDDNGQPHPAYWEGQVETEFGAARWDTGTHQVIAVGPATFKFSTKQGG